MTDNALSALQALDPGVPRDEWVVIAWAAHAAGVSEDDFVAWSSNAGNFKDEDDAKKAYRDYDSGGRTQAGTLYKLAKDAGWKFQSEQKKNNKAQEVWESGIPATVHNEYIARKLGDPRGLKIYKGTMRIKGVSMHDALMVPCYSGKYLNTVQMIHPQGKDNIYGEKLGDGYFTVGDIKEVIYLCEGLGQAWTANTVTEDAAIVCFSSGRIKKIAETVRRKHPSKEIIIVADRGKENEMSKIPNTGYVIMPEDKPDNYDINDLYLEEGLQAVRDVLKHVMRTAEKKELEYAEQFSHCYITHEEQKKLFDPYYYIIQSAEFLVKKTGLILKEEEFDKLENHINSVFPLDIDGKYIVRKASDAFFKNTVNRQTPVFSKFFDPFKDFLQIQINEGTEKSKINTYKEHKPVSKSGDVSKFLKHIEKMMPSKKDREIIISYMAAIAQYPGKKFNWCIVLQGAPGNGKSTLAKILAYVVGKQYTVEINGKELSDKFNNWKYGKLLVLVHEAKDSENKRGAGEILKNTITESTQRMREMHKSGVQIECFFNFFITLNELDGLEKINDDRRLYCIKTAQQAKSHLALCGITYEYMKDFYDWLNKEGFEIITHYLKNFDFTSVPMEYNPANLAPAPTSEHEADFIDASRAVLEQKIKETIEEGVKDGFKGNFVNMKAIENLAEKMKKTGSISVQKITKYMYNLGYEKHPALITNSGRTTWDQDGGRPILYVKKGSYASTLTPKKGLQEEYKKHNKDLLYVF